MTTPTPEAFAVNPTEAIEYFRQKENITTEAWTDLWEGQHARAFVVAGANRDALVADFRQAVDRALSEGKSLGWFRQEFDRIVAAHGWSYKGSRGWRSAIIFNTNLRMAYAAGRWQKIMRLADRRPWLRYVAVMDERTRPLHRQWHDTVLRWDHPWWQTFYPPNGWNCRCTVQQLSDRDLVQMGLRVSPEPPMTPMVTRAVTTPQGRIFVDVPKGVDPGFAYNTGVAAWGQGAEQVALEKHGKWKALTGWRPQDNLPDLPLRQPVAQRIAEPPKDEAWIRNLLRTTLGGADAKIFIDPTGSRTAITQAIVDHWLEDESRLEGRQGYIPLIPELITDPEEIWIGFSQSDVTGRVTLRRRYVKLVEIGDGRVIGLVCDVDGGFSSGLTFFIGRKGRAQGLRQGYLLYRK